MTRQQVHGTLVLALAHQIGEDNCTIYTQDISQKSNEFLRLNLILNNLVHSLGNVVHGNTLTEPAHLNESKTRLAQFDYIVSNPPFKTDFSEYRDDLTSDKLKERFFAGVPKVPNKDKEKMAIYLMFIQHIIYSLNEKGKAAIVVPTGFLTAQSGIEKTIRERFPNANISPVDYDPGASESNQTNRIKLLMTVAKDNLKREMQEKNAIQKENTNSSSIEQTEHTNTKTNEETQKNTEQKTKKVKEKININN